MIISDTHTHLYLKEFDSDRDQVINKAIRANVTRLFLPAIDSSHTQSMLTLKRKFPKNIFLMAGLHPCYIEENYLDELKHVEKNIIENQCIAVGEIGIDLHWETKNIELQKEVFMQQIRLAKKYNLPIVIHSRKSYDEIFEVLELEGTKDLSGIFHCFTGTLEEANKIISMGMKLGIGGVVTFKNGMIDKFLDKIDLKHIVLETDSPYLAPSPNRGKRNESAFIINIAEKLTEIYQVSIEEIINITTNNSIEVFKI
ncbi:MAG: TatD family hydrolase [Flavobacteriaceae bacterium]|jgi:TatD DNase family protein|nr:TatD family hydrolase [Flavobacteriaceae bacterium]MBT4113612.1 TatD family hydrolase [Flavobacteriaceae bacterium]MBT4614040.1 TatD family hydrolase [Flavobacteriaceae bacterium]MBT5245957.1 TatD family hydrolase [Flavobacteriaceae bacterium]MBT5650299.1 TatD family hydrolase [Flavobacteriaceae bacterium]